MTMLNVACIQTNTQNNLQSNLLQIEELVRQAAESGATFITLPENVAFMAESFEELKQHSFTTEEHPALLAAKTWAKELNAWLLIGSLAVKISGEEKLVNRCFLLTPQGAVFCHYDKIHLYDVQVSGGETHKESDRFIAGNNAVIADAPWGKTGLTICYDVRFPHLYRRLAQGGASIITVPAAFTQFTGEAHWHVLLRARAIETGSFIVAPAQTGSHPRGRKTFGHSLIISPWGEILADAGTNVGICTATLDLAQCQRIRAELPSLILEADFTLQKYS